jgi:glycosyltransferase involved in cell wall biosynthesis
MVTYNHERYVAQAIESALAQQTTFAIEIVIGEDCSTDGTRRIVQQYAELHPDVIRTRLAERNQGGKLNFVDALKHCRGEYVVILEGDDYFTDPLKLQRQADALDARVDWGLCFHPARCLYEGDLTGPPLLPDGWDRAEASIVDLFERNFIATSGAMFRRRQVASLPAWFLEIEAGDWALHILNAAHGPIGFIPEVMSAYRIHSGGAWSSTSVERRVMSVFKLLSAVDHHFKGRYAREIDENRQQTLQWLFAEWRHAAEQAKKGSDYLRLLAGSYSPIGLSEEDQPTSSHGATAAMQLIDSSDAKAVAEHLQKLLEEHFWLKEAHRRWTRSIFYRIVREIQRPWKQLWSQWHRLRHDNGAAISADGGESPSARAA